MFALPGSSLWLFLLIHFACGQILDITSLDTSNKGIDDLATKINHTSVESNEGKNKNKTMELETKDENKKSNLRDVSGNLLVNKTSKTDLQVLSNSSPHSNKTVELQESLVKDNRKSLGNRNAMSNTTEFPMMSQERRNSYLSIAERRKYYNRTRVHSKKPQLIDVESESQETESKRMSSSTEAVQVNEIRVVKKPSVENISMEVTAEKNQTSNPRIIVNFPTNEVQVKPQSTRQSVIQSQYQFGQKLNLRKPVSRAQDLQEERLKRRREKSKIEFFIENSTNKFNKNYPTLSTKLIRVDKFHWATTTVPKVDSENENFVMHSYGNETVLEKLVDHITDNNTEVNGFPYDVNTSFSRHNVEEEEEEEEEKKQTKVPQSNSFTPLPLSNSNTPEERNLTENITVHGKRILSATQDIHHQEIFKLNNTTLKAAVVKKNFHENSIKHFLNYSQTVNHSASEILLNASNILSHIEIETTTLLGVPLNSTNKTNLLTSTTSLPEGNRNFSVSDKSRSAILKRNFNRTSPEGYPSVIPSVKAIFKESSHLISRSKLAKTNAILSLHENVSQEETNKEKKDTFVAPLEAENASKAVEYPMTIELNENNKRVLSEMFQTLTTSKPNKTATTSQPELNYIIINGSSDERSKTTTAATTTGFSEPQTLQPFQLTTVRISTTVAPVTADKSIIAESPLSEDHDEEEEDYYKAQGTQYNTKFYVSSKLNETKVIRVIEEDENNDGDVDVQERSAGVAIYVLAAFGMVPLLVALVFGAKFMIQRNHRQYDCESDAKSDISVNESQIKESKKKKSPTNLKKSPSNVTTITLVNATRLPRVQHWEDSDKQGNRNWEFPRSKIKLKTILGQGNFGQVWKAEAEDMPGHEGVTRVVAVKTVKEGATEKEHTEFIKELEIMQQIGSHPHIVTLLGCCTDQEPYYLIMEYVKHGKLLTYLREHRINENYYNFSNNSDDLTSRDLTVFAYCVARGMEYLASRGIIHRDLAARNVLVDHNKLCKIADFGMSRSVRDFENGQVYEERQQKGALPIRWMAPESLVYSVFTYKSDVWSFGILMWEIVTLGSTPYPNMGAREVMRKVRDGYRLERPSHCKPELYRLISYCWTHDPNKRPDFSELRHELGTLLDNPTKDGSYVDLDHFAVSNNFHISAKTNDFRLLERNDFKTLQKLGDWENKDWPKDIKKIKMKKGNNGKGTVTLTGQGSFTVNSRILEKEFKII